MKIVCLLCVCVFKKLLFSRYIIIRELPNIYISVSLKNPVNKVYTKHNKSAMFLCINGAYYGIKEIEIHKNCTNNAGL